MTARVPSASAGGAERESNLIGEPQGVVRCFAFGGGGFDTIMQLGVVHALLVSDRRPPDVVVGISAGAVNAVTLAEVLQAGKGLDGAAARAARLSRFRKLLKEYEQAPGELIRSLRPDPYEIGFRSALRPLELPIHQPEERRQRAESLRARAGLIRLLNGFFRIRVTVGDVTRAVRYWLGLREAEEIRRLGRRSFAKLRYWSGLVWLIIIKNGVRLTRPLLLIELQVFKYLALSWLERSGGKHSGRTPAAGSGWRDKLIAWFHRKEGEGTLAMILPSMWVKMIRSILSLVGGLLFLLPGWAVAIWAIFRRQRRGRVLDIVLASYDIAKDLGDPYFLQQLYVRAFDPEYYGTAEMSQIAESALRHDYADPHGGEFATDDRQARPSDGPQTRQKRKRTLQAYSDAEARPPIHVIPVAADLGSGKLEAIPSSAPVVDALMAATAIAPFYRARPVEVGGKQYIDGINVANEPTLALLDVLRRRLHPKAHAVEVYPVSLFPLDEELGDQGRKYTTLMDVVMRALQLRRYRDATLEQRLTQAYNSAIPRGMPLYPSQDPPDKRFVSASVYPIQPNKPMELNRRILEADSDGTRRRLALRAVAQGCRATLEAMLQPSIQCAAQHAETKPSLERVALYAEAKPSLQSVAQGAEAKPSLEPAGQCAQTNGGGLGSFVSCRKLLEISGSRVPRGIPEVCRACARSNRQKLALRQSGTDWPLWPGSAEETPTANAPIQQNGGVHGGRTPARVGQLIGFPRRDQIARRAYQIWKGHCSTDGHDVEDWLDAERELVWPNSRQILGQERLGNDRPLVSLLFSGGVFRGVFQLGVLSALSELELRPDIVAGSSVGSITAALVAEVFRHRELKDRRQAIAGLCATFLGLDRLILTDRFADFVRRFTLRAARTDFSPRDADEVFRRYDAGAAEDVNRRVRRVVAGLERLFYVSPYELNDLIEAGRRRRSGRVSELIRDYAQEFLERHNVGLELLGAEPLKLLICKHIIAAHPEFREDQAEAVPLNLFAQDGIRFLATATNLEKGSLDVLDSHSSEPAFLLDGLLASSAFPGVFRPRWSWEVRSGLARESQLIDGGVMDNLPLEAVIRVLDESGPAIKRRPKLDQKAIPHLLFAASLEVNIEAQNDDANATNAQQAASNWVQLWKRARRLSYNHKLTVFEYSQRDLRRIYESQEPITEQDNGRWEPLDIEVVAVRPEWLCKTFAMHPMLGFRRTKQAESIAHGCAATLARFARLAADHRDWLDGWGIKPEFFNDFDPSTLLGERRFVPRDHGRGNCCLRANTACPFSAGELARRKLPHTTYTELQRICEACRREETHSPERP